MKPEHWQRLDQLFHAALERTPEERAAFLDEACAGDESLRKQVEALVAAHEEAGSFIESPAMEVEARGVAADQGSAEEELAIGKTVSHYRIIAPLGIGGMGQVYLAQDMTLGRKVALKLLPSEFTRNTDRVRRFQQEARAASSLNHPNIITIHEIGQAEDRHFIATEYIDGLTLREYLREPQSRDQLSEALNITMQVADALAAAHAKGIVHRDIKPENIMLVRDSHLMQKESFVKVLDFGIAKLTELQTTGREGDATTKVLLNTHEGSVIGTASYMSPEQARGESVDARTDIWSLGVVLYEMLTNDMPFGGNTTQDVIASILKEEAPPISIDVPDRLRWIVEKALRKEREERYQTAREMFSDLRDLHQQRGSTIDDRAAVTGQAAARRTSRVDHLLSEVKSHRAAAVIVLMAFLFAVAGIAFGLYKFIGQRRPGVKPTAAFQTMKITRLTSTGKATSAAISPDGRYVVHVVNESGQQSLWMRQAATLSNVQIVPPADVYYLDLNFSPDGDYLYYVTGDKKTVFDTLYQMPVLGGAARRLVVDIDSVITFSPDSKQFAFLRGYPEKGEGALILAKADGTSERELTVRKYPDFFNSRSSLALGPAWSPDGKVIVSPAGSADAGGPYMMMIEVSVADGAVKPITPRRWSDVGQAVWLRDGSGLVFMAREQTSSPSQLWYLSYPSGEAHRITNDLNDYLCLSLTADSTALVTVQTDRPSDIWVAPDGEASRATQITFSKLDGWEGLAWTPDDKIVYASRASGNVDLWITDADGSNQKQLTNDARNNSHPAVSPDGRYIVFVSGGFGTTHIWRMEIDGSSLKQLTNAIGEEWPNCSPDGKWVIYNSDFDGTMWKVPMAGGDPEKLTDRALGLPKISPDGKLVAGYDNGRIAIYPFEGGQPIKAFNDLFRFNWAPSGRALEYIDHPHGASSINSQPLDGSPPKRLTNFKSGRIFWFARSRDGKQLALARGTVTNDVVLITDFRNQQ